MPAATGDPSVNLGIVMDSDSASNTRVLSEGVNPEVGEHHTFTLIKSSRTSNVLIVSYGVSSFNISEFTPADKVAGISIL